MKAPFSSTLLALGLLGLALPPQTATAQERPNVVIVMTDDMGYGDLGITGNPVIRTPNLDRLGAGSAIMSQFYVSPVCSPTRACLMTGRYNHRTRVIDTYKGHSMMEPDEVTLAELLSGAGYATGIFGKWHLGDNYPLRAHDQGFEEALVHNGGGIAQPSEPIENRNRYTDPILFRNGEQVQMKGYCTDIYFDAALEFIDQASGEGRPFFAYIPTNAPHGPYHDVPEALYEHYKAIDLSPVLGGRGQDADRVARIFAMIENIDQNVGKLRGHLEAKGLLENTLIIYLNDNGPNSHRFVGPFRGAKGEVHEGGIRTPFFAHWPARLSPGTSSGRIAAHIDILPTILEATGVEKPEGLMLDGLSLLPLLEDKPTEWPDRPIIIQAHRGPSPVPFHHAAVRTQRWKLVHPTGFGRQEMRPDVPFELYDIELDPGENHNLAEAFPEKVEELKTIYRDWLDDVSSTRPDNYAPPRIVVGTDHETTTLLTPQDWQVGDTGGWGSKGEWLLTFAQEANYAIDVLWDRSVNPETVTVHIGDARHEAKVVGTAKATTDTVTIPTGKKALTIRATDTDGRNLDPRHVVLRRL